MSLIKYKYDSITDEKCQKIIEMYDKGMSDAEVCRYLEVSLSTFRNWRQKYPEFKELIEVGKTYGMAWWCKNGREALYKRDFNFAIWLSVMKNRYGYGDKPSQVLSEMDGWKEGDIENNIKVLDKNLADGEICMEKYEIGTKALTLQAKLYEIMSVIPVVRKMELDIQLEKGEITEKEYTLYISQIEATALTYSNSIIRNWQLDGGKKYGDKLLLENRETETARSQAKSSRKRKPNTYDYKKHFKK